MVWKYKDILHGHFWTTLNGLPDTPDVLEWTMLITKIILKDTKSSLPIGLGIFLRNTRVTTWCMSWWSPIIWYEFGH